MRPNSSVNNKHWLFYISVQISKFFNYKLLNIGVLLSNIVCKEIVVYDFT